jgi:cysteinyl-tRNA synthetase
MEEIKLYSTSRREKVKLETIEPGKIRMYVCGPTVYDKCHIGHARPAVCFDTIRRYLEYAGYAVNFISNITDIDDKIINRANELGISCSELASRYQDEYEKDMTALGVRSPTIRPKATEHIQEMLDLIQMLMDKGVAYTTERGVWFDVSKFKEYGKLSGRVTDDENTEHRVEQDGEKRNPQDFALWKSSKPGEPEWDSPWGKGRPGWHIECSAMSGKYCDFQLDIHGGGADLAFPHHENEVAQSEAATGKEFVRYWMHNGFITVAKDDGSDEKMGKSKGNAFWLQDVFAEYPPAAVRFWILGTHYRIPLTYSGESLRTAMGGLDRIYNCREEIERYIGEDGLHNASAVKEGELYDKALELDKNFRTAMNDDFNTPQALAVIYDLVTIANTAVSEKKDPLQVAKLYAILNAHMGVLGIPLSRPQSNSGGLDKVMDVVLNVRQIARKEKQFAIADAIRDNLGEIGIEIADRPEGATWLIK